MLDDYYREAMHHQTFFIITRHLTLHSVLLSSAFLSSFFLWGRGGRHVDIRKKGAEEEGEEEEEGRKGRKTVKNGGSGLV